MHTRNAGTFTRYRRPLDLLSAVFVPLLLASAGCVGESAGRGSRAPGSDRPGLVSRALRRASRDESAETTSAAAEVGLGVDASKPAGIAEAPKSVAVAFESDHPVERRAFARWELSQGAAYPVGAVPVCPRAYGFAVGLDAGLSVPGQQDLKFKRSDGAGKLVDFDFSGDAFGFAGLGAGPVHTTVTHGDAGWAFGAQAIAGVSVPLHDAWSARFQARYVLVHDADCQRSTTDWCVDTSGTPTIPRQPHLDTRFFVFLVGVEVEF